MRRNEVDAGSQPVRNVYTNPQFETASGTGAVRTNLNTNPAMVATSGVNSVRANMHNGTVTPLGTGTTLTTGVSYLGYTWTRCTPAAVGYGARAMCNAADLVSNSAYMSEWEIANDNAASITMQADWCDGGFNTVTLAPGERKRIRSLAYSRVYDTTYRFTDAWSGNGEPFLFRQVLVERYGIQGPYFDGSTPTIYRTNICHNPNLGAGSSNGYAVNPGGGTATGAYNSGAGWSGTGFYRATWTAASTGTPYLEYSRSNNPEVLTPGKVYTFSGYVRSSEALTVCASIGWANASAQRISGQDGTGVVLVPNTWMRVSMTTSAAPNGTVGAWFDWKATSGTVPIGGTFDVDGVLIEESLTLGTYFDGSSVATEGNTFSWSGTANSSTSLAKLTDATYAWAGAAGSSMSYEQLPAIQGWSQRWFGSTGGAGWSARMTGTGPTGGYTYRKTWTNANTGNSLDTGIQFTRSVTAGTMYVASIYQRSSVDTNLTCFVTWKDSGGATISATVTNTGVATPAGVWTRHFMSATAPTGAVTADFVFGPYTQAPNILAPAMPQGAYIDWSLSLIEPYHSVMLGYFDGSTAAAGDFTYNWTGGANGSSSEQRGAGLPGVTSGNSMVIQSTDWAGSSSKSLRIYPNTQYNTSSAIMLSGSQLERGKTYTAIATRRLTAPLTGTLSAYAGAIILVQTGIGTFYSNFISNVAGLGVAKLVFKLVDDGSSWTLRLGHGGAAGSGDVWWDNFMIVEGDYSGDYINPTQNVLAKWDGTAHASTSVGYPPQLLDIAGKPAVELIGATGDTGNILAPDAYAARTVYFVYEHTDPSIAWQAPMYYARPSGGPAEGLVMQTSDAGAHYMYPRADFTGGTQNGTTVLPFGRGSGVRHVIAMSFPQGLASSLATLDGAADVFRGYPDPTVGWASGRLYAVARTGIAHIRSMVFYTEHDRATRLAISHYLGNKYGAAVA